MKTKEKMLWNLNLFFKDMYGVQSGEFVFRYWDSKH